MRVGFEVEVGRDVIMDADPRVGSDIDQHTVYDRSSAGFVAGEEHLAETLAERPKLMQVLVVRIPFGRTEVLAAAEEEITDVRWSRKAVFSCHHVECVNQVNSHGYGVVAVMGEIHLIPYQSSYSL